MIIGCYIGWHQWSGSWATDHLVIYLVEIRMMLGSDNPTNEMKEELSYNLKNYIKVAYIHIVYEEHWYTECSSKAY